MISYFFPSEKRLMRNLLTEDLIADKWHTGTSHEDEPATQLKCNLCGDNKFYVAQGDYWTGIKCPNCGYEIEIHEG